MAMSYISIPLKIIGTWSRDHDPIPWVVTPALPCPGDGGEELQQLGEYFPEHARCQGSSGH